MVNCGVSCAIERATPVAACVCSSGNNGRDKCINVLGLFSNCRWIVYLPGYRFRAADLIGSG